MGIGSKRKYKKELKGLVESIDEATTAIENKDLDKYAEAMKKMDEHARKATLLQKSAELDEAFKKPKESIGTKVRKVWYTAGEDVYVNKKTGEIWVPALMGGYPPNFNAANWKLVKDKKKANKLKESFVDQKLFEKQELKRYKKEKRGLAKSKAKDLLFKQTPSKIKEKLSGAAGLLKTKSGKAAKYVWGNKGRIVNKGIEGSLMATEKFTETANRFAYVAPSPIQIFSLAWKKMSKSMKTLLVLIFAVVILFVPWGVFYYAGWALGAGVMFLLSLIYWVFINMFNGVAYILVMLINGVATILLSGIIWLVEMIIKFFDFSFVWTAGRNLRTSSLISYKDIATSPKLMNIVTPKWQPWMNTAIVTKIFEILGINSLFKSFSKIYENVGNGIADTMAQMPSGYAVLITILIPLLGFIAIIAWVYHKNRLELMG